MACETCGHTMHCVDSGIYWCPRCGTILSHGDSSRPFLVDHVRRFRDLCNGGDGLLPTDAALWHRLGIEEAIEVPERRVTP